LVCFFGVWFGGAAHTAVLPYRTCGSAARTSPAPGTPGREASPAPTNSSSTATT